MPKILSLLLVISCLPSTALLAADEEAATVITVAYTTDVHGVVLPEEGRNSPGCLARAATVIRQLRQRDPELILIDNGDTIQGNPLMYVAARYPRGERVNPIIEAMNLLKYDALAIGNHEFNFGSDYLRYTESQASFPFLSANVLDENTGEPAWPAYHIIERKGLRIGVIGLVTDGVPNWELPAHIEGLKFISPEIAARKYVPLLREEERCDVVIVSLHDGLVNDPARYGTGHENPGMAITRIKGVDLLLTGHVHRLVEPALFNGTMAATAPPYGRGVMAFSLHVDTSGEKPIVSRVEGEYIEIDESVALDEHIVLAVSDDYKSTEDYLSTAIASTSVPIIESEDRDMDSPMVDLLHKAQLDASGADLSQAGLLPWGGFELAAGEMTIADVFRFYPYENMLVTVEISGARLREVLEWSARYFDGMEMMDGRPVLIVDGNMARYDMDSIEGVSYRIDPLAPEMNRVKDLRVNGRPVADDDSFTLALNSYRKSGGGGYAMLEELPIKWQAERGLREIFIDYIRENGLSGAVANHNWFIAPDYTVERRK